MRAIAKIDDRQVSDMNLDITFRMTVAEWRELMRETPSGWTPAAKMGRHISSVLGHITKSTEMTFTDPKHEAD
jgi:predicted DNA-binding ribbon-helix-helix protein